jgi:hypothetical protein
MKYLLTLLIVFPAAAFAQDSSIVGAWQLVNQTSCLDDEIDPEEDEDMNELVDDMKSRSGSKPKVIEFKANNSGKESTRIISQKRSYNSSTFLYRLDGRGLYFLDKRSHTLIEGFSVEKLASDTLIITNNARACETKMFVRIK